MFCRSIPFLYITALLFPLSAVQAFPPSTSTPASFPSTSETKLNSLNTVFAVADTFWRTSPYTAAALTCAVKGSVADLLAQKYFGDGDSSKDLPARNRRVLASRRRRNQVVVASRPKADWKRNIAYAVYGSIYQGIMQEYIFNHLYPMFFGAGTDIRTVATKVAFNLLIHAPLLTIPIAYVVKAMLYQNTMHQALEKYMDDIRYHGLLKKFFLLWGPVQSLTFSVIPEHFRVTFIALVSFFWMIILSSTASKASPTVRTVAIPKAA